ncbi:MAG: hypothetical protein NC938_07225 [Candidatus Omnitrophica bacterium]|nr:hypothetical protein [Candidatus Omnitrophota bacterium]MCM8791456.1 hypothetical protein [Candidatus Omnitrophota bacterium]
MKTRFDENVAAEIPKTRSPQEPELPWKVTEEEISKVEGVDEDYKVAISGTPPLHARAIFIVLLVVSIFIAVLNSVISTAIENSEIQLEAIKKERQVSSLKDKLQRIQTEKAILSDNAAKLEKKVNDLNAQKELYASVIETLTKKTDDIQP